MTPRLLSLRIQPTVITAPARSAFISTGTPRAQQRVLVSSAGPEGSLWIHLLRGPTSSLDWRGQAHLHTVGPQPRASLELECPLTAAGSVTVPTSPLSDLVQSAAIPMRLSLLYAGFTLCGLFAVVSLPPLPNFFFFNTCCCTRLYFSRTAVILCDSILYPFRSPGPSGIHRRLCVPRILSTPRDCSRRHVWQRVYF